MLKEQCLCNVGVAVNGRCEPPVEPFTAWSVVTSHHIYLSHKPQLEDPSSAVATSRDQGRWFDPGAAR